MPLLTDTRWRADKPTIARTYECSRPRHGSPDNGIVRRRALGNARNHNGGFADFSGRLSSAQEPLWRNREGVSEAVGDDRAATEPGHMQPARIAR